jgi:hypothetical protein
VRQISHEGLAPLSLLQTHHRQRCECGRRIFDIAAKISDHDQRA